MDVIIIHPSSTDSPPARGQIWATLKAPFLSNTDSFLQLEIKTHTRTKARYVHRDFLISSYLTYVSLKMSAGRNTLVFAL